MTITGQPSIDIIFKEQAVTAITRSEQGIVALLLQDSKHVGPHRLTSSNDIPKGLSAQNQQQLRRAFIGNNSPPQMVLAYVFDGQETTLEQALNYLDTEHFNYLAPHAEMEGTDTQVLASWVKTQRQQAHRICAVLPEHKGNHEGIVNFTSTDLKEYQGKEVKEVSTTAFCSFIAGLLAGTSLLQSATYSRVPNVADVKRLTKEEQDAAVKNGEFILFHDTSGVKTGRAVNSLVTTGEGQGETFQKIKTVRVMDLMYTDIHTTVADHYIGKYTNSYDNKCLVITAIQGYLEGLEAEGLLARGKSLVEIDIEQNRLYLLSQGIDTTGMSEQDIKEAVTGSFVFLRIQGKILDAMEDFLIAMYI